MKSLEDMTFKEISDYAAEKFANNPCESQCLKCGSIAYDTCVVGRGGLIVRCSDCEDYGRVH